MITHLISKIREAGIDIRFMTDGQEARLKDLNNPLNKQVDYQLISSDNWFYSNAEHAVHAIAQDKATPTQWLAMLTKAGGIKAGEDRWLGLSDWLKVSTEKTLTKEIKGELNSDVHVGEQQTDYINNGDNHTVKVHYPACGHEISETNEDHTYVDDK